MQKTYLNWDQIEELTDNIVKQVRSSGKKYDWIIGLNRGGLIPSVRLSHKMKIIHGVLTVTHYDGEKLLAEVKKDLYISGAKMIKPHHNILVVDDIADTGICLKESVKTLKKVDPDAQKIDTATLFYKPKSIVVPTYYAEQVDNDIWVEFPWEQVAKVESRNAVGV